MNEVMHFEEYGNENAPLLLFLHGGGVGGWMWDKQIDDFSHYHCIVPTLQGHGVRRNEEEFSIRGNAEEMIDLIKEKGAGKDIHIIGFSIGAQICLEMIDLAPTLITSAVINSATVIPMKYVLPLIAPTILLTFPLVKSRSFAKVQAKQLYMDGEYFEKYYEDSVKLKPSTLIQMLKENMSYALPENRSNSTVRILVTVGERETRILKKSVKQIVEHYVNCKELFIPNMGHGFPVAQPQLFNEVVEKWITKGNVHKL
ncbi:alpha/beta fold hydrolase [Sporosarcina sp. OR05]|uniref:alpha/beta fold hydrolase n=1 Tax=Sporosarcina sp. OR05 TaxID=2969819 RepID=UPI00352BBE5F